MILSSAGRASSADQELLIALRNAWEITPDAPFIVIGRVRSRGEKPVFFLEELEHPTTGSRLVYPEQVVSASAYIPASETQGIADHVDRLREAKWAIAELILSPDRERLKHANLHGCMVRRGTLHLLLEDLPRGWDATIMGGQGARLLTQSARAALEEHVRAELLSAHEYLTRQIRADQTTLQGVDEALAQAQQHQARIESERAQGTQTLATLRAELDEKRELLDQLGDTLLQKTQIMEQRFRHLSDLLEKKGNRLRALGLVDEADIDALMPPASHSTSPAHRSLQDLLGGDFARLAPFLQAQLWRTGMLYSQAQLRDFLALMLTHDLVVLAGDSGAGKTSLVRSVAAAIGARCSVIPVKPNWTGPEDLLGYYNPIERCYHPTPFLQCLQRAEREPEMLHFICLDEMNLARVEHYFADFLSLLEARGEAPVIPLYTSDEERHIVMENGLFLAIEAEARRRAGLPEDSTLEALLKDDTANHVLHLLGGFKDAESVLLHHSRLRRGLAASMRIPTEMRFPQNVRIVGAINVDETTHYLSPKVLDRVHVLRFRNPVLTDWGALEAEIEDFDPDQISAPLHLMPDQVGPRMEYPAFERHTPAAAFLLELARNHLDPLGIEFGLRAIRQSLGYLQAAEIAGIDPATSLNNVILHKVLPKVTLDTARTGSDGRNRRDILVGMRDYLRRSIKPETLAGNVEDCVVLLDRVIAVAEGNNGIANYWLR